MSLCFAAFYGVLGQSVKPNDAARSSQPLCDV
jgi:hypothetical protein